MAWFPCNIGGGSPEPTPISVSMKVKTTSVSGYTASVQLTTYDDVRDVVYSTVMGESNAIVFGAVRLYYDSAWYLKAFTACEYDGNAYNEGDLIRTWGYTVNVDMKIDYTVPARGNATMKQGTFVSATSQYGIVDVNCGFEPDLVIVKLPFTGGDTTSYWEKGMSWAETKSMWNLYPVESVAYVVDLGRTTGETGIQAINNNGFSFMSNSGNTQGVTCEYIAVKYEVPQPQSQPTQPVLIPVFGNTSSGNSTYTIIEDGLYLIEVTNSYQGSRSITLPSGRTPIVNEAISGNSRGTTIVIAELQSGDEITLSATASTWLAFSKSVFLLKNIDALSVYDTDYVDDTTLVYNSIPSTDDYYMTIGVCFGREAGKYYDSTVNTVIPLEQDDECGAMSLCSIRLDKGRNFPELSYYGYDGGGAYLCVLKVNVVEPTPAVPFEKEILHSIVQDQSGSSVPVSVTFTKDYQIAFLCGLISDNVYTGAISVNALGGASELYGLSGNRYASAGIAIQLPSNKILTGYFPYSDGGAYYDIFGAIGMSRLPSEYEIKATIDTSNISMELSKVYDHIVVFVGMDSSDSNTITLTMNGTSIPLTVENEKFSRYSYHASEELTSDSATLNFTYSGGTVNDNTIVVFAYNE